MQGNKSHKGGSVINLLHHKKTDSNRKEGDLEQRCPKALSQALLLAGENKHT